MSNRMSSLRFQAIDANGNVRPGAKLSTYFSGTTTPIATYTDSALTIAHANPIIADGKGEFPQIFLSIAEHRMVLTDADDVQIAVYDPVTRVEQLTAATGSQVEVITATSGQTVFNLSNPYILGINGIGVFINGVLQHSPNNYTETNATTITFTSGLDAGDEVTFSIPNSASLLVNIGTAKATLTDDSFITVTPSKNSGMIEAFAEDTDQAFGKLYFDVTAPSGTQAYSGTLFDASTGALTGTTGVDGRMTVSPANDGKIYIENRLGATKVIVWQFVVSS